MNPSPRAWLLMSVGDDRQHAGNSGYDDRVDEYYSWDSKVPNSRQIKVGDPIALWDRWRLLGISVVEHIETSPGTKIQYKCTNPACGKSGIKFRKRSQDFLCSKCGAVFLSPVAIAVPVTNYVARHNAAWTPLQDTLSGDELRTLAVNPGDQLAMRRLNWDAFAEALTARGAQAALSRVNKRIADYIWAQEDRPIIELGGGHVRRFVRVRKDQGKFRTHLLHEQGERCAFTGAAPDKVLEAGHLYSFAEVGVQFEHGGMMMRRDIHRLFDEGWLAVDPSSACIDVASDLETYPQYARLHDQKLFLPLNAMQEEWLDIHWREYRAPADLPK